MPAYGTAVAAGYLLGIFWLRSRARDMPRMTPEKFWAMIGLILFGAVAGGKILFALLNPGRFSSGHMGFISAFRFGFVFFGGLLGAMLMAALACRWLQLPYLATADFFGVALPMGHAVGRLGCLAAGCCHGRPTDMPWGLRSGRGSLGNVPLHPTQLYEAAANAAIATFLLLYALPRVRNDRLKPGTVFLGYWMLYSAARFVIEFFRGDERGGAFHGLSVSQWIALAGAAIAADQLRRRSSGASLFRIPAETQAGRYGG